MGIKGLWVVLIQAIIITLAASAPSANAASGHAYVVDAQYRVRYISLTGRNDVKSPEDFALSVSVGGDGSAWVVSTDQGVLDRGGNLIKVLRPGKSEWETIQVSSGAEATNVSGDATGGAWIVDGQTQDIIQIDPAGKVISGPTKLGPMFTVSAALSGDDKGQIWAIGLESNKNIGNPVYYMLLADGKWKPRGVGAQALSGYWTVSSNGQVVTVANDSTPHVMAPAGTATSISLGSSDVWIISTEANIQQGGAYMKVWNQKGPGAQNWEKIPNIGVRSVAAE